MDMKKMERDTRREEIRAISEVKRMNNSTDQQNEITLTELN